MQQDIIPIQRALISVSDKTGIAAFAQTLHQNGVDIVSTGKTQQLLNEQHVPARKVEDVTHFPEMMAGRVKTLHPHIHGGILGRRDVDAAVAKEHHIQWIDLVVVNLYPFATVIQNPDCTFATAIENIDIGGPAMIRSAAKNFTWVAVIIDPEDYAKIAQEMTELGGIRLVTRQYLAEKAFAHTAAYDAAIANYLLQRNAAQDFPPFLHLQFERDATLRYGENPHQQATAYRAMGTHAGILSAMQLQGKALSYNNITDADAAWSCVQEFSQPACVIVKHANPCGAAIADTITDAFQRAYQADPLSAFGGVIALNQPCTKAIAAALATIFVEVIIAPDYDTDALAIFAEKPNVRLLVLHTANRAAHEFKFIAGGLLMQERDAQTLQQAQLRTVTTSQPTTAEIDTMLFAWQVVKHIKSNAILIANHEATIGIGAGQVSRIDAVTIALSKAQGKTQGAILASDAFFPFRDSIDKLTASGIRAVIQPGGSVRDEEVIAACNEQGIAMVFTGIRCFKH